MIKTSDLGIAEEYGVDEVVPEIVYFENGIPSLYPGESNICLKIWSYFCSKIQIQQRYICITISI